MDKGTVQKFYEQGEKFQFLQFCANVFYGQPLIKMEDQGY